MTLSEVQSKYKIKICHRRLADFGSHTALATKSEIERFGFRHHGRPTMYLAGGETIVKIYHEGKIYKGVAVCSEKENYCKKSGRELALSRAVENLENGICYEKD